MQSFSASSQIGPYAIVPRWVSDSDLSDRALRVYVALCFYADHDTGEAYPSMQRLADTARCSVDSVERAMKELVLLGAVDVTKRRQPGSKVQMTNLYCVKQVKPDTSQIRSAPVRIGKADPQIEPKADPHRCGSELDPVVQLDPDCTKAASDFALCGAKAETKKLSPQDVQGIWNRERGRFGECRSLGADRLPALRQRLREHPSAGEWEQLIRTLVANPWYGSAGPDATFDYILKPRTWTLFAEGRITKKAVRSTPGRGGASSNDIRQQIRDANVKQVARQGIYIPGDEDAPPKQAAAS